MHFTSRFYAAVVLFSVVLGIATPTPAFADVCDPARGTSGASCVGKPCDTFGVTEMDGDETGIVGCFKTSPTNSTLAWKSMPGGSATGRYQFSCADEGAAGMYTCLAFDSQTGQTYRFLENGNAWSKWALAPVGTLPTSAGAQYQFSCTGIAAAGMFVCLAFDSQTGQTYQFGENWGGWSKWALAPVGTLQDN